MTVKIKIAAIAKVGRYKHSSQRYTALEKTGLPPTDGIIAIGASTGGTEATLGILRELGDDLPGIVIVQHMPPVFTRLYAERLNNICTMEVREAKDKDEVKPGTALIAPGGLQMGVARYGGVFVVECRQGEKISGHCPSVDYLFDSVSKLKGINRLGIIMTGMGSDGARGLLAMRRSGASTIGQNQQTCVVYGMPAVAKRIGAVEKELPLGMIAHEIYTWHSRLSH